MKVFTQFLAHAVKKEANLYCLRCCNTQDSSIFTKSQEKTQRKIRVNLNVAIDDVPNMKRSYVRFTTLSFSFERYL